MHDTATPEQPATPAMAPDTPAPRRVPWYTLNPRAIGRTRLLRALIIGLCIVSISVVPLWRLLWYFPVYGSGNFKPVRDAHGQYRSAWHWVEGREIRVYQLPGTSPGAAETIAEGAKALVDDAGLNFTVKALPLPDTVLKAYEASTVPTTVNGQSRPLLDFGKLESQLILLRDGDPHADMLVVDAPLAECQWAHGMATITSGVAVLEDLNVDFHLGKHETGHLMGYLYHDSLPLYVIGYPWEGFPWSRDSLMVLYGQSTDLSPRSRDALRYFWRGMEQRMGHDFLNDHPSTAPAQGP